MASDLTLTIIGLIVSLIGTVISTISLAITLWPRKGKGRHRKE